MSNPKLSMLTGISGARRKYDSQLAFLYACGKENLLPEAFRKTIPASTAASWRTISYASYYGHEFRYLQQEGLKWVEIYSRYQHLAKLQRVIARIWIQVSCFLLPVLHSCKEAQSTLMNVLQQLFTVLPKSTALRLAGLSTNAFRYRFHKIRYACSSSPLALCLKRHPWQLSTIEIKKIRQLLTDPAFACWPLVSVYYHALRNKQLGISLSTFYKYAALLGLKRKFPKPIPLRLSVPATRPNEFLHLDTTFVRLPIEQLKAAVVFVTDSYSKVILGWSINRSCCAQNVMDALKNTLNTIYSYYPNLAATTLIADGGAENHAHTVADFLAENRAPEITKVVARKNILFSNSQAEAINKIMKRYIRYERPDTLNQLHNCLVTAVEDYNNRRPHGSLIGQTPMEAYTLAMTNLDFSQQIQQARQLRKATNQRQNCPEC